MAGRQKDTEGTGTEPAEAVPEGQTAGHYAREAVSQWSRAIGLATTNTLPRIGGWRSMLASSDGKGGRIGDVADKAISKFGKVGTVASKAGVGSRVVESVRPDEPDEPEDESADTEEAGADDEGGIGPIPIQESVRVAAPLEVAFRLATTFQDYPAFTNRVKSVDADAEARSLELVVATRGADHHLNLEIERVRQNERIDWRCADDLPHLGTVTFHELAPKLTHIEVSIDRKPSGLFEKLGRRTHLTDRALHADLQRFKAYAELWEDEDGDEGAEGQDEDEPGGELDDQEIESEDQEEAEAEPEPAGVD